MAKMCATWTENSQAALDNDGFTVYATGGVVSVGSTIPKSYGKWYWEVTSDFGAGNYIGIGTEQASLTHYLGTDIYGYSYVHTGQKFHDDVYTDYGDVFNLYTGGNIIGIALDMDNGKIWFSNEGIWQAGGNPVTGVNEAFSGLVGPIFPMCSLGHAGRLTINSGQNSFFWDAPSGFAPGLYKENFIINVMHDTRTEHNAEYQNNVYQNVDQIYGGLEPGSYQEHQIFYYAPEDKIHQSIINRKSYPDIENVIDRKVEGPTVLNNIRLHGRQISGVNDEGAHPSYISWLIIRKHADLNSINLDGSELYIPYENVTHQLYDYKEYADDLTSVSYQHESSFGGNSYNLSNNECSSEDNVWVSDEYATTSGSVYVTIYFDRTENLVSRSRIHYDSGHEKFYNASKLSDSDVDVYERDHWRGQTTSGWATINFGNDRPIVNVFGIKAVSAFLDSCPKSYKFFGGLENSVASFKLLSEGEFVKTTGWQSVSFTNENPYKYYKFEILNTYGDSIKVQEWSMYDYIGSYTPKYVSQLRLHPADFGGLESNFPKQISLEGSNNMLNWEMVLPFTNTYTPYISHNASYGKWQRYSFTNIKGYWHYRVACKDNWGASNGRVVLGGWEMCELAEEDSIYRILGGETNNIKQIWASEGCDFEGAFGLLYMTNEKLNVIQNYKLVEEKNIPELYKDINVV